MNGSSRILLTGGTGFFGRSLLRTWIDRMCAADQKPTVTVLTRSPEAFISTYPEFAGHSWLRLLAGDVCAPHTLPHSAAFTHILHAAADSTLGPQLTPLERYDQIVNGTRNLLDLAVSCGAERFLFVSSGAVYGSQPSELERIPETWHGMPDPLNPDNAYGVAKRAAEHLCALYGKTPGLDIVIARCFAFVGPDLPTNVHFAIGNFIHDALHSEAITVAGDGTPLRTYMDQNDLAEWLLTLLARGRAGSAYNVGGDEIVSIAELARLVRDAIAPDKPVKVLGATISSQFRNRYVPDVTKAREELGLSARVPLLDAIRQAAFVKGRNR